MVIKGPGQDPLPPSHVQCTDCQSVRTEEGEKPKTGQHRRQELRDALSSFSVDIRALGTTDEF